MLTIDGRQGEGGGQILRSSLALAALTGTPVTIENIRAGRSKPGLLRQHLTAVRAAKAVCGATVHGDEMRSSRLVFEPGEVKAREDLHFAVGTAGSAMLVLQTVLPVLMQADAPSQIRLEGGTHNPFAPTFEFLQESFAPQLAKIGPQLELELRRPGFYPAGGGEVIVQLQPAQELAQIELLERGDLIGRLATAGVSHLPGHVARRELDRVAALTSWPEGTFQQRSWPDSRGPGNVLSIELEFEEVTAVFTGFGQKGKAAEKVADEVVDQMRRFLAAGVPVEEYLADQLMLPMALAGGGRFRTIRPSQHSRTHAEILETFLDVEVQMRELDRDDWEISITS